MQQLGSATLTKNSLYSLIYNFLSSLIWNKGRSLWFQYIIFSTSQLQILFTLSWTQMIYLFGIQKAAYPNLLTFVDIISIIFGGSRKDFFESSNAEYSLLLIGLYFLLMLFISCVLLRLISKHQNQLAERIKSLISYWAQIHHEVLFLTIGTVLSLIVSNSDQMTENSKSSVFTIPISIILLIFNYGSGFLFALNNFDPFRNNNHFSCHKTNFQVLTLAFKGIVIFLISFFSHLESFKYILFPLNFVILGSRHYMLVKTYPYFRYSTMKFIGTLSTASIFLAFSQCIILCFPFDIKQSMTMTISTQCFFLCLSFKLFSNTLDRTILKYLKKCPQELRTEDQVQKKLFTIFYLLEHTKVSINENNSMSTRSFLYLMSSIATQNQLKKNKVIRTNDEKHLDVSSKMRSNYSEHLYQMAVDTLNTAIQNLKHKNILKIELAHLVFTTKSLFPKTIFLLASVKKNSNNYQELVRGYKYVQLVQEDLLSYFENKEGVLNIKTAFDFEQDVSVFLDEIRVNIDKFIKFWKSYINPSRFSLREFVKLSSNFERQAEKVEDKWNKLDKIYGKELTSLYPLYSIYLNLVRNAFYSSQKINEKFRRSKDWQAKEKDKDSFLLSESLLCTQNIHFQVIMSKENLGKVAYCSKNITHEIGWSQEEIIGKNIVYIMPPYMQDKHQNILVSNLENLSQNFISANVSSFVRTNEGFLKPCSAFATLCPYIKDELTYFGIVRTHKLEFEAIILDEEGYIDSFTKKISSQLGLSITEKRLHIKKICPFFDKRLNKALKNCGIKNISVFPLSNCINSIKKNSQEHEESFDRGLLRMGKSFLLSFPFILDNADRMKRYFASFEVKKITQSCVIVMNIYHDTMMEESTIYNTKQFLSSGEPEEWDTNDNMDELNGDEMDKYLTHGSLTCGNTDRFAFKVLPNKLTERKLETFFQVNNFSQENLVASLDEVSYPIKINVSAMGSGSQSSLNQDYDTPRNHRSSHYSGSPTFVRRQVKKLANPKIHVCSPEKYLSLKNKPRQRSAFCVVKGTSFARCSERRKIGTVLGKIVATPQKIHTLEAIPKKHKENGRSKLRWLPLGGHNSSVSFSLRSEAKKIEKALNFVPKDIAIQKSSLLTRIFILICGIFLVFFHFHTNNQLETVYNQIDILTTSRENLHSYLNLHAAFDSMELLNKGLISNTRLSSINIPDLLVNKKVHAKTSALTMQKTEGKFIELVSFASAEIQKLIHNKNMYKIYENEGGQIVEKEIEMSNINAVEKVINIGLMISQKGLGYSDEENLLLFRILDDLLEKLLFSEEHLSDLIKSDCARRVKNISNESIYLMLTTLGLAILLFFLLFHIQKKTITKRNQIIEGLFNLDEDLIHEHIVKLKKFHHQLKRDTFSLDFEEVNEYASRDELMSKLPVKRKSGKKTTLTNGIDIVIKKIALFIGFLLVFILSGFFILFMLGNSLQRQLSKQIELYFLINEFHYKTDLLQIYFNEFVSKNNSTFVNQQPIEFEWEKTYDKLSTAQEYLANIIYKYNDNLLPEQQENLKQLIEGNICQVVIDIGVPPNLCPDIADGSFTRGIISLNTFILSSFRKAKEQFAFSNRTPEAMKETFGLKEIIVNEEIREPALSSVYLTIQYAIKVSMNTITKGFIEVKRLIILSYLIIYVVSGLALLRRVMIIVQNESNIWRKMFRQIPYSALRSNKLLFNLFIKDSNESFARFENYNL